MNAKAIIAGGIVAGAAILCAGMATHEDGKNAVLISEDDWRAIEETLYLNAIPNMTQSILAADEEPLSECTMYDPSEAW